MKFYLKFVRKSLSLLMILTLGFSSFSQELNAEVTINSDKITGSNKQVYQTLQKSLTEFLNQTQWTTANFKQHERIDCSFTIIINSQSNNKFDASLQVQSSRPVYGTSYNTPILNIKDNDFSFSYTEFEVLNYNPTSFDSNLISTLVYYVYFILGIDADTFANNGGNAYYKQAENVVNQAQQRGGAGWQAKVGVTNRYVLIKDILSENLKDFRDLMYLYHRQGLDIFSTNSQAKQTIENAISKLENVQRKQIGNSLIRLFFDAKSDEISSIFSDGIKSSNTAKLKTTLQQLSPSNREKWNKIK